MRYEIPDDWLENGVKKEEMSPHALQFDRWDLEYHEAMIDEVDDYREYRDKLADFTPTGEPATTDAFLSMLKADPKGRDPEQVLPSHMINSVVNTQFRELPETSRLRRFSVNDEVQSALSFVTMEPDLETLFDKHEMEQKQAEEFEKTLINLASAISGLEGMEMDLDAMVEAMKAAGGDSGEGEEDGDGDGQGQPGGSGGDQKDGKDQGEELTDEKREALDELAEKIQEARKQVEEQQGKVDQLRNDAQAQAKGLQEALPQLEASISVALRDMISAAADEAQAVDALAMSWGIEKGELQRMNAEERFELAKKLNSPRFKQIADLIGPMKNMMLSEQVRKTTHSREEIYDTELGSDLSRLLPSELMGIRHPLLRKLFQRKYVTRALQQYAFQGTERLARGGIIMLEDGSGSMKGQREMWAKAIMLCLLHLARIQKRTMHLIHFGSPGQFQHFPFVKPADFSFDKIVEAAEYFANGGTDFETPMREALKILQAEFAATGGVKADVLFVTDGECWVRQEFMDEYLSEMHRMSATTWGVDVTGGAVNPGGPLHTACEGKVARISDFFSGGDMREIFRGV